MYGPGWLRVVLHDLDPQLRGHFSFLGARAYSGATALNPAP